MKYPAIVIWSIIVLGVLLAPPDRSAQAAGATKGGSAPGSESLIDRYGDAAADVAVVEDALEQVARKRQSPSNRHIWDSALERIARLSPEGRDEAGRKKLANAWSRVAELVRKLDGPTPQYLDCLEVAFGLDPENEQVRREVDYQRERKQILELRVAEAARVRAAREAGRDPYADLPHIGGPGQRPAGRGGN